MTSRLDRLFILLESGTSTVTRNAAAKQIGEVQKLHPHELHNLLNRLVKYLHSTSWETRIAAAHSIEAILNNVPVWNPKPCKIKQEPTENINEGTDRLTFEKFDVDRILSRGAHLMGSEGTEFDCQDDLEMDIKERLQKQRALLNAKLGLSSNDTSLSEIMTIEDVNVVRPVPENTININMNPRLMPIQNILYADSATNPNNESTISSQALSSREMNRAKRKARQNQQQQQQNKTAKPAAVSRSNSSSNGSEGSSIEPDKKKVKLENINLSQDPVPDATGTWIDAIDWPLESFCSKLYLDLFNPRWETRHGAATGLREIFKLHSVGAGKSILMTESEMELNHNLWLEDAALRLLCVLMLDRFGDFISDQVIAPVRETCAQVLGTILNQMNNDNVIRTVEILLKLVKQTSWEVRHGGLLGIKYLFVVKQDMLQILLPMTLSEILNGLFDAVDDVGAVAASTLIPIASWLPKLLSHKEVSKIMKLLWDLLLNQDELTSASNSFMGLLAAILNLENASCWLEMEPMTILVPRLWPFLCHNTSSVRKSTALTLKTLSQHEIVTKQYDNGKTEVENNSNGNLSYTLHLNYGVKTWPFELLNETLRHIFQRALVEPNDDIQEIIEHVWNNLIGNAELSALLHATCPVVSMWMCLAMQPARLAFDPAHLIVPKPTQNKERKSKYPDLDSSVGSLQPLKLYLGGSETTPQEIREKNVPIARCRATRMLGALSKYLVKPAPYVVYTPDVESPIECYTKLLLGYLQSKSAIQRIICGLVISFWASTDPPMRPGPAQLQNKVRSSLNEYIYYDEVATYFTRLLQESRDFLATLKQYNAPIMKFDKVTTLTLDQIQELSTTLTDNLKEKGFKPKILDLLMERRRSLQMSLHYARNEQNSYNITTQAVLASSAVALNILPEKLNPIIKPLMESIKREECVEFQRLAAKYLVTLLDLVLDRSPCPNNKIVTNLCALLKSDQDYTPKINEIVQTISQFSENVLLPNNPYHGIITLQDQKPRNETQNGHVARGPGRPPVIDVPVELNSQEEEITRKYNRIQRCGSQFAVIEICNYFGKDLFKKLPVFWTVMYENIIQNVSEEQVIELYTKDQIPDITKCNELITSLQLIETSSRHLDKELHKLCFDILPVLCVLLKHPLKAIRHMTSRCFAVLAETNVSQVMEFIIDFILPQLEAIENVIHRQGAAEAIACIVQKLQFRIVPFVALLVVPLLGRMSDPDESVRLISTHCFATSIQLMPLDGANNDNVVILKPELLERKKKDKKFLEYLFTPKTIPDFKIPLPINAELRSYQQSGINWLWFLNQYKLHGILCDDMGLGKTLQTICILAGDHYLRQQQRETQLPSLVICPPTLTGHWVYEVEKFLPNKFLMPLQYVGLPTERERLRSHMHKYNLIVASYEIVRKDIAFFSTMKWNYCVLDEGHIIKNGKTKSSKAVKKLIANHRLILSGTPIQNNVLELWSLFDFLMPGFLGTEKQFVTKFSRPILASRDAKSSSKEQEQGALAMESLHRQVLPFLLRRIKEDVLTDLPPKITQDLLCELSPLQKRLYEDFSRVHLSSEVKNSLHCMNDTTDLNKAHVFQALRYLQNVCNHPKLVLTNAHPEYQSIQQELTNQNSNLDDISHSAKLPALKQLLLDCGIGGDDASVNQHRALIFCQLKAMLNIVEFDLLKKHMPAVSYLRLDGSVPPQQRHSIVTKFNSDPSIDVLLLTTQVGGLGLNLTGADTVIFVEHDWNPMKDLQAMDRAHRIGQRKVVNVYRLITHNSLEEKIMGLQKFKLLTAKTVVSDENASMETMATDQLLDLFELNKNQGNGSSSNGGKDSANTGKASMQDVLQNLPDLWDDKQYEEEYDLSQFIESLN